MGRNRYSTEQIIRMLREAEVDVSKGTTMVKAVRKMGITEQTYNRWRREYNRFRPHSSLGYKPPAPLTMSDLAPEAWRSTIDGMEPLLRLTDGVAQ